MADALKDGDVLAVFPEGTTSDGLSLLPFHANLLQAAIAVEALGSEAVTGVALPGPYSSPGSITDAKAVDDTVRGADIVVQLATTKEDADTFFDVSIRGTFNVLEACRALGTNPRVVFTSSLAASASGRRLASGSTRQSTGGG